MIERPLMIEDTNLSRAWVRAFTALSVSGAQAIAPLVVTVTLPGDGTAPEVSHVTALMDEALTGRGRPSSSTTATTIFPSALWNPACPRSELFRRYVRLLPKLHKEPLNCYGIYFERLIAFGKGEPRSNQLDHIISVFMSGNHRRSALQASILDPARDHTNQRRRHFPCLQQVSFLPDRTGNLAITGYYATQYIMDRAFGNYLGLCRLGEFMAHEMGLRLTRMTCVAATGQMGGDWKRGWRREQVGAFTRALADAGVALLPGPESGGEAA